MPDGHHDATAALKSELALGYRAMAFNGLGLGLLAHLTARLPGADTYWTYQIGQSVEEVRVSDLAECTMDARPVIEGKRINPSILCHGDVYRARPDVTCILHHHSKASIAMGAIGANLRPFDRNSGRLARRDRDRRGFRRTRDPQPRRLDGRCARGGQGADPQASWRPGHRGAPSATRSSPPPSWTARWRRN